LFRPKTRQNPLQADRQELRVRPISKLVSDFLCDESGATAIEYALIATGISITIVAAVTNIGTSVSGRFTAVSASLK
jgi:pilus assembly protein Flp/PilA